MKDEPTIGRRIAAARAIYKMTQADLAEKIGVSVSTIVHWENGDTSPRVDQVRKIADILCVPLEDLLR